MAEWLRRLTRNQFPFDFQRTARNPSEGRRFESCQCRFVSFCSFFVHENRVSFFLSFFLSFRVLTLESDCISRVLFFCSNPCVCTRDAVAQPQFASASCVFTTLRAPLVLKECSCKNVALHGYLSISKPFFRI